jgi:protoheme IX farnesyltransferase
MTFSPSQYWALTKPRVVALIVFTAIIGMFLAMLDPRIPLGFDSVTWLLGLISGDHVRPTHLGYPSGAQLVRAIVFGGLGIWLAASSAAAINHLLDQGIDALMARTSHRPLPTV